MAQTVFSHFHIHLVVLRICMDSVPCSPYLSYLENLCSNLNSVLPPSSARGLPNQGFSKFFPATLNLFSIPDLYFLVTGNNVPGASYLIFNFAIVHLPTKCTYSAVGNLGRKKVLDDSRHLLCLHSWLHICLPAVPTISLPTAASLTGGPVPHFWMKLLLAFLPQLFSSW